VRGGRMPTVEYVIYMYLCLVLQYNLQGFTEAITLCMHHSSYSGQDHATKC